MSCSAFRNRAPAMLDWTVLVPRFGRLCLLAGHAAADGSGPVYGEAKERGWVSTAGDMGFEPLRKGI